MRIAIDGIDAFAATGGRPLDATRPLVVLIHGAGMDSSAWALQSRWIAHHGCAVLAVDLPGHGRSAGAPLPTIAAMADWAVRLVAAAGAKRAILIGHSMGSLIALEAAARHPESVAGIGLIATAAEVPVHPDLLAAARANAPEAAQMVAIWGCGFRAGLGGSPAPGLSMLNGALRVLERAQPGVLANDLAACGDYKDGLAAAARVSCPTVIVAGQHDQMTSPRGARALAERIAGATLVVVPDSGHMLMAERPDAVLAALRDGLPLG